MRRDAMYGTNPRDIENANAGEKSLLLRQAMPVSDLFRMARGGG
jgi:hypothetical protein